MLPPAGYRPLTPAPVHPSMDPDGGCHQWYSARYLSDNEGGPARKAPKIDAGPWGGEHPASVHLRVHRVRAQQPA